MAAKLKQGDQWAAMECVEVGVKNVEVMGEDADGNKYVADSYPAHVYVLRCNAPGCGNVISMPQPSFLGKRVMLDCGCGKARLRNGGAARNITISVREEIRDRVIAIQQRERVNFSQAATKVLLAGLSVLEGDAPENCTHGNWDDYFDRCADCGFVEAGVESSN